MDPKVNLCTCVDSFRKAAEHTSSSDVRDKLEQLTTELAGISDVACGQKLTPQLKCLYDNLQGCEQSPGSERCDRFFSHADKLIEACRDQACC